MKKCLILFLAAITALISCGKDIVPEDGAEKAATIAFNLTANHPGETKAIKTGWESGDAIFVFFTGAEAPKHLKMSYNGTSWTTAEYDGDTQCAGALGLSNGDEGTMTAVFLPFGSNLTVAADGTSFIFSEIQRSYYLTGTLPYSVTNNTVSGAFNMAIPDGFVQFFINDNDATNDTAILREVHIYPTGIGSISASGEIVQDELLSGEPLPGYVYDKQGKTGSESKGLLFSGVLKSDYGNSHGYYFLFESPGVQKMATVTGKNLNKTGATGRAVNITNIGWQNVFEMVDLGLPSGTLWASVNLGAVPIYNWYGEYFAWGETEQRNENHTWSTYKWGNGTNNASGIRKYICDDYHLATGGSYAAPIDNKSQLDPEDDAATVRLGAPYCTPTAADWQELWNGEHATFTWTNTVCTSTPSLGDQFRDYYPFLKSSIYGFLVTSKHNGNSIFLPANNDWGDNPGPNNQGTNTTYCCYWSSSLETGDTYSTSYEAFTFDYGKNSFSYYSGYMPADARYEGRGIRPVIHQ